MSSWNLHSNQPIFLQIIEKIQTDIIAGFYQPGDKLPSVRELAQEAQVNPNTMQKALSELERTGLVYSQRTSGRYITQDIAAIQQLQNQRAQELTAEFLQSMNKIGYSKEDISQLIRQSFNKEPPAHYTRPCAPAIPHPSENQ